MEIVFWCTFIGFLEVTRPCLFDRSDNWWSSIIINNSFDAYSSLVVGWVLMIVQLSLKLLEQQTW